MLMKLMKMMKKIGTHSGQFHCDEVLACYMLKQLPEYKDADIIRTRDRAELAKCDIVVDVGGEFDPERNRFDHHQKGFEHTLKSLGVLDYVTKLSSAGLVYAHFGREVIKCVLGESNLDQKTLDVLFHRMYARLVEEVDAGDNGITQCDGIPRFAVTTTLASRVGNLNPCWNSKGENPDEAFAKAMTLAGGEFNDRLTYFYKSWMPAKEAVERAVDQRKQTDATGRILYLSEGVPWKEHFFHLEKELPPNEPQLVYIIYAAEDAEQSWRVQCIPVGPLQGFESRLPLPEEWRGLREEALSKESGVDGCVFCHATGFIGGNRTKEGALAMAKKALQILGHKL